MSPEKKRKLDDKKAILAEKKKRLDPAPKPVVESHIRLHFLSTFMNDDDVYETDSDGDVSDQDVSDHGDVSDDAVRDDDIESDSDI